MPMTTPVCVRINRTDPSPSALRVELMTPESWSRMTHDKVRTTPLIQNGISTQRTMTRRSFGPTTVIT